MKPTKTILLAAALSALSLSATPALEDSFKEPPAEAAPWCFWYWMYGAVSEEGIKADLEAMKRVGLGGTYLMPIRSASDAPQFGGKASQLTPEWWRLVGRSIELADSLGLRLGMHICDGFALAGGPWIRPDESMQMVVSRDTIVSGGNISITLPKPGSREGYYEDISLLALPVRGTQVPDPVQISVCGGMKQTEKGFAAKTPGWIQYEYPEDVTICNIEIELDGNNYQAHRLSISVSDDGEDFHEVTHLTPARHGWQNTDCASTHAITPVNGRYFRLSWTPDGSEPGSEDLDGAKWKPVLKIRRLTLSGQPRIHQWEGKTGLVWRVSQDTDSATIPNSLCVPLADVIDLSEYLHGDTLTATLPEGRWQLLRTGHTSTGHTNATAGAGKGLEADKFNREAVAKQVDNWFGRVFEMTDSATAHRTLTNMHVDSWECGSQNWSRDLPAEFEKRRGYSLLPWIPLLSGIPMEDAATSERVLRDLRTTIAELVRDVFYDVLAEKAREYGCTLSAECVSPTMVSDGMMHFGSVDLPMGEFWFRSPTHDKPNDILDAIHGAHAYGKNIVQAEGFTEVRGTWDEAPAMVKTLLDRNYALGINRIFYHVNAHNPWLDRRPGMTLDGIGLFFQRDNTWFEDGGRALTDYMRRCQAMLQYGKPVVDIAVFTGEEIPRRAILPDRLVPSLPGIFGEERVKAEAKRLANVGQPLRTIPVGVTHSANMADPEKWIDPLRGYTYDSLNKDALLNRDTLGYPILVLPLAHPLSPNPALSPETEAKVEEFKADGTIVPTLPYTDNDFTAFGIAPDALLPEGIAWCHRRDTAEGVDLYFVSNQEESPREITASFRISGRIPELWNPMDGSIDSDLAWHTEEGRTVVKFALPSAGSAFIVFREPTAETSGNAPEIFTETLMLPVPDWSVTFHNTGDTIHFDSLRDWTDVSNPERIRDYSGTATYASTFKAPKVRKGSRILLNIGRVCDIARVTLNGHDCGIAWTAPYTVDITDAIHKGENKIEIAVTNTWANALRAADNRNPPFEGIWTNAKYRLPAKTGLLPAGLLGPLTIEILNTK